jgi:hypothetical protein
MAEASTAFVPRSALPLSKTQQKKLARREKEQEAREAREHQRQRAKQDYEAFELGESLGALVPTFVKRLLRYKEKSQCD